MKWLVSLLMVNLSALALIDNPKVSIITSVFTPVGGESFIEDFLKDITRQTIFRDCELILINANSPGNEEPIIREFMQKFPENIVYERLELDPGLYASWNVAIKKARAPFISNANLDDHFAPFWLETFYNEISAYPDIDLVYGDSVRTYVAHGTFENHVPVWVSHLPEFSKKAMEGCPPQNQPMWRKSMHDKYGFFDESFRHAGDWEYWCRAVEGGARFKKIPGVFGVFYINPVGLSSHRNTAKIEQIQHEESLIRMRYQTLFDSE